MQKIIIKIFNGVVTKPANDFSMLGNYVLDTIYRQKFHNLSINKDSINKYDMEFQTSSLTSQFSLRAKNYSLKKCF